MTVAVFFAATVAVPILLGLPLARRSLLGEWSPAARVATAWAGGTVSLTAFLTALAALGIPWQPWLVMPLALAAGVSGHVAASYRQSDAMRATADRPTLITAALGAVIAAAGSLQLAAGAATSADLSYVWGVKAVNFALDRGMDFQWMQQPHLIHLHSTYPPLWPVSLSWGALAAGSLPWTVVPVLTAAYLAAAVLIVHALLRRPLGTRPAAVVALLWYAVLTGSTVRSFSGGSAEGPLLLFVTVAATALVAENRDEISTYRWLAAGALAGAVLTKSEGLVSAGLIVAGTAIRDCLWRRPAWARDAARLAAPAIAAAGGWAAIRIAHGLPLTDPIRETAFVVTFSHLDVIVKVCGKLLVGGGLWVGWLVPLVAASATRRRIPLRALPGLAVAGGLPLFAVLYYLHADGDPLKLIVWTFPRLIQPAISVWIVSLGVVCFGLRSGKGSGGAPVVLRGRDEPPSARTGDPAAHHTNQEIRS